MINNIREETLDFIPNNFDKKINNKKLLIIGCGGIGSHLIILLAKRGFNDITVIDNDKIDITNIPRQSFTNKYISKSKTESIKDIISNINTKTTIKNIKNLFNNNNAHIIKEYDLIIDCTDNFETRHIINQYCQKYKKNWIYNGTIKTNATSCIFYHEDNNYEKLFNQNTKNEKASDVGILNSSTYLAAALGYNMVLKYFLGIKENKMIKVNLWNYQLHEINLG